MDHQLILDMIQWDSFYQKYAKCTVSVTNCTTNDKIQQNCQKMIVADYKASRECLYIKDWHFEHLYNIVFPCTILQDWMNEYFVDNDFKFLYLGKKGSWTPIHTDVYHSHSWSLNLVGRKLWYFFDPTHPQIELILNSVDARHFNDAIVFTTEPGDVIWVPSGYAHQVHNLDEDTLSCNRNWCDKDNILTIATFLLREYNRVVKELSDIPMDIQTRQEQTDLVFLALTGISVQGFCSWTTAMYSKYNCIEAKEACSLLNKLM